MVAGLVTGNSIVNPDSKLGDAGVNVVVDQVTRIDRSEKKVILENGSPLPYDKLVLGMGADPIVPPLPGTDLQGVFILRSLRHAEAIRAFIAEHRPRRLTFIGAGFISLEIAVLVKQADPDCEITVVEMFDAPLPTMLDPDLGARVGTFLEEQGISLRLGCQVQEINGREGLVDGVTLDSGETLPSQMVWINVGSRPNIELAKEAGLDIGRCGIAVNEYLETSDPDILAAGDCADNRHFITGKPDPGALRGPAVIMGRLAAKRLAGFDIPFPGLLNASACHLVGLNVAATGLNSQQAREAEIDAVAVTVETRSKHGMIPGAEPWTLRLLFDRAGRKLIGGQIVSKALHPVKKIDAVSALILGGKTAEDLAVFMAAGNPDCSSEPSLEPIAIAGEQALQKLAKA